MVQVYILMTFWALFVIGTAPNIPIASAGDGDFHSLSMSLLFAPGSGDGALMCSSISILADNVTEFEEDFIVELALVTAGESLSLGNNATAITHIDDDGNQLDTSLCGK